MQSLNRKIAVVTGVTSGIGKALATKLSERGVVVIGIGRSQQKLAELEHQLDIRTVCMDLADQNSIDDGLGQLFSETDRVDILVNNAAECVYVPPMSLGIDNWRRLVDVNLNAVIHLCRQLADVLSPTGDIVNISSVTADFIPTPRFVPYAMTKAALKAFTDGIRLQLAPRGTRVTLISPGLVDTEIYQKIDGFEKTLNKLKDTVPVWLTAADVANAIIWALEQPNNVSIGEIVLTPRGQAR